MLPLVKRTVADLLRRAEGRRSGIVFAVNVAHAEAVLARLQAAGERAALVHGGTPKAERAALIERFQAGALRWMVNVNVLSEGFDAPGIDVVAMLRPTKSPGLYYQQVGRGFRLAPGKADCLVLDYAGNVLEHGPVDQIKVRPARPRAAAKVETGRAKECPKCQALLPVASRECPECGHSFGSTDPNHLDRPVDAPVLSTEREPPKTYSVNRVAYERWDKPNRTPSLRVIYQCGLRRFSEWVCIEHGGFARTKALDWWMRRAAGQACPRTVDEALAAAYSLTSPTSITVDESGRYPEIVGYAFAERLPARTDDRAGEGAPAGPGGASSPAPLRGLRDVPGWLLRAVEHRRAGGSA
jgi:DNA repair protein RadD